MWKSLSFFLLIYSGHFVIVKGPRRAARSAKKNDKAQASAQLDLVCGERKGEKNMQMNKCLWRRCGYPEKVNKWKERSMKSFKVQRVLQWTPQRKANTLWPYEPARCRLKFPMKDQKLGCGLFEMRIIPYPMRPLENDDGEWEMAGIGNEKMGSRITTESRGYEEDISHLPVHNMKVWPTWRTWNPMLRKVVGLLSKKGCKAWKRGTMGKNICQRENEEKYYVGKKSKKWAKKWNADWTGSFFTFSSMLMKFTLDNKARQNSHPGKGGTGAINMANGVYEAYRDSSFVYEMYNTAENRKENIEERTTGRVEEVLLGDDGEQTVDSSEEFDKYEDSEKQSNIMMSDWPIVFRAQYDIYDCPLDCRESYKYWWREQEAKQSQPRPFYVTPLQWLNSEGSERIVQVKINFRPKWVYQISYIDGDAPNVLSSKKSVSAKLTMDRMMKLNRVKGSFIRVPFRDDGFDVFKGETLSFRLDILTDEDSFEIKPWQNPFLTMIVGKNTMPFGAGVRRRTMNIKPRKGKLSYGTAYTWRYELIEEGTWHRWYLRVKKMWFTEKQKYDDTFADGRPPPDEKGCRWSMYAPGRPVFDCSWGPLKLLYNQQWLLDFPPPGSYAHAILDRIQFMSMNLGQKQCGKVRALLDEWPSDGNKWYTKLIITIEGPNGGLVFDGRSDANILRFPEYIYPWELKVFTHGVKPLRWFLKYRIHYCVIAKAPGTYALKFSESLGSLKRLFPTPPDSIRINVGQTNQFEIKIDPKLNGLTVFNREWSPEYTLRINRLPDKKNEIDTDLIVTPSHDNIQFRPTKIRWSVDQPNNEKQREHHFKFRPLLDCAIGGVQVSVTFQVAGMVQRLTTYPLPAITLRVREDAPSAGCEQEGEAEEFEEFAPEETPPPSKPPTEKPSKAPVNDRIIITPESKITLTVALFVLAVFGLIVVFLCAFGCLGPNPPYEAQIATQLRKAIMARQRMLMDEKMTEAAMGAVLPAHYDRNVDARKRLMESDNLFASN